MKLLIISAAFPPVPGGEADHILHLAKRLAGRGLDVHVLTTKGNETSADLSYKVYPIMRDWSWSDLPRFLLFLGRCAPQTILLNYSGWIYNDHPMITFAPSISKFLLPRCSFVTQFGIPDGSLPHTKSFLARAIRKAIAFVAGRKAVDYNLGTLLRDSDRIIVLSEGHTARLSETLPAAKEKMVLIPPPPLLHMMPHNGETNRGLGRDALRLGNGDFVLAYFGYINPGKGLETLLRAFQIVASQRRNVRLILIGGQTDPHAEQGTSYFQKICELARRLNIEDEVSAWEYGSDSFQGSLYLHAADACVLPFDEGITLNRSSFAGAAAHGLPIITTEGNILESPFVHGKNVLLCPPKSPEKLAAAIESLICSAELRQRLSKGALEIAREWFSWDTAIERTLDAFVGQ
jgi:glycosyltransferase involved in cell wall biosynthesis